MKRRGFLAGLGAATTAVTTAAAAPAIAAPAISQNRQKWRLLMAWPRELPGLGTVPMWFAEKVTQATGGRLTVEVFGAGEIVPAYDAIDAVADGTGQIGHGAPYYWKGRVPALQFIANFPFGMTAQEYNAWYFFGGGAEVCDEVYGKLGCKFLPGGNVGVQMGGWFNKEINSIADFKGLKMRMPGLGGEVIRRAGATVVDLPGSEVPGALASGIIDAAEWNNPYGEATMGFYRYAKYYYHPGWHEPGTVLDFFVNQTAWEELPDDLRTTVEQCAYAANHRMLCEFVGQNSPALDRLIHKHDVTLKKFPNSVMQALGRLSGEVLEDEANKDPLSRKVFDHMLAYRRIQKEWSSFTEASFLEARNLDFPFPKG